MNGSSNGVQPVVELATNNGGYAYPAMPYGYGNGGFGFGGDGIWAIVLVALLFGNGFGGWGNGFGGLGGATDGGLLGYALGNNATKGDLSDGLSDVVTSGKLDNITTQISDGFSNQATNLCNVRSDILTGNMSLQNSILDSKYASALSDANLQRDILMQTNELNNNLNIQSLQQLAKQDECCCTLRAEGLANTQRILDAINNNTIQDLRDKLATANNQLSDQMVINTLAPRSIPAYLTSSPYQSIYNGFGWGNGFYGNGFFGNTIV